MDLIHSYSPRGTCKEVFENRSDELLVSGPAGTGKSRACLEKLHFMCLINPNLRCLIVRKTATSLSSTALSTYKKFVAVESLAAGHVVFYGGGPQDPAQYRYTNGSTITIGGMDKSTRIMSSEYDMIYVQEATELSEDNWEALTTRLRNWQISFQQLLADCNPDTPTHWLKIRTDNGRCSLINSRHEDNPVLFTNDGKLTQRGAVYMSKLDNLTGVRYLRLRKGLWSAAEGLIYEEWDPAVHVLDRFEIPFEWTRYWTVDFGYTNPFVLQCWAEDPDGRLYLYREIYHTKRLVEDHAKKILSLVVNDKGQWIEPRPRQIICDHDAEGRATFTKHLGMGTTAAHKKVTEGIQAVQSRLRTVGDGKPRLFILRDSLVESDPELIDAKKPTCTLEEKSSYIWADGTKEVPKKEYDHGMDAERYLVAQLDLRTTPNIRWM